MMSPVLWLSAAGGSARAWPSARGASPPAASPPAPRRALGCRPSLLHDELWEELAEDGHLAIEGMRREREARRSAKLASTLPTVGVDS